MTGPAPDLESAPYWAALTEGRIVLQECRACHRCRFPRLPACPYCASTEVEDKEVSGRGHIYSFVRVHRALTPESEGEVPYCIATVDLEGDVRVHGRIEPPEDARIGLPVEPLFVGRDGWTELRFRVATAAGGRAE